MKKLSILLLFLLPMYTFAQDIDSLVLINGDVIVGEIKNMDKGVVEIETPYSDSNFKIEWDGIEKMYCNTNFMITLSNGKRYNGHIRSTDPTVFQLITPTETVDVNPDNIVYLKSINNSFISKLSANVDVGYSYAKANNLSQLNASGYIGYTTHRWQVSINATSLKSTQDDVDPTERNEGGVTGKYFLPHDFYLTANVNFLSNTEQSIDLRTVGLLGIGKYIIHTNTAYWGFTTGASYLNESFDAVYNESTGNFETQSARSEAEWFLGTEINLFDTGDLSFMANAKGYRSLGGSDRWRADVGANVKYDLPLDFYIKMGYNMNYDTQPAEAGKEVDYQYTFGFGWEL